MDKDDDFDMGFFKEAEFRLPKPTKKRRKLKVKKPTKAVIKQATKVAAVARQKVVKGNKNRVRPTHSSAKLKENNKKYNNVLEKNGKWFYKAFGRHWLGPFETQEDASKAYDTHEERWMKHYSIEERKFEDFLEAMGYDTDW